ncbi:amino acid adenylation domain-containing protein [Micromonospora sp. URMC 106]|uniref:amino acid adenylation domain-containing protein n=1 Tax=Micromonospora sp. URMC 106 TaxID=3423408 RepID=UPI003F19F0CC
MLGQPPPPAWFDTARPFPRHLRVHDLVSAAADRVPDRPALVTDDGVAYTHRDLDRAAGRTAAHLRDRGVGRGAYVGLLSGHHPEAVRGLLGVLRAGAAYVPVDPRWPLDRIGRALRQVDCACVLADVRHLRTAFELADLVPTLRDIVVLDGPPTAVDRAIAPEAVEDLWDTVAARDDLGAAAGFNLRAGAPTFTGRDIDAYRDHVVALADALVDRRSRVLEIGCGAGLILRALAGRVSEYVGVDPSSVAIGRNQEWARQAGAPVTLRVGFAHELATLVTGAFDLVILASTAQFLPGPRYLEQVLRECGRMLTPGGRVIVADVIDPSSGDDPGLLRLPTRFFRNLRGPGLGAAQVLHRTGSALPAPLAERYDVLLSAAPQDNAGHGAERVDTIPEDTSGHGAERLDITTVDGDAVVPAAAPHCTAEDPAYCIFTSGSTGDPKGVVVPHRAVVNLIDWVNREFGVTPDDRLLFVTSFAFDLSVYDMFGVLAAGASVRLVGDRELADPDHLVDLLHTEEITFWDSAPAAMAYLLSATAGRTPGGEPALRRVFLSGDWIPLGMPAEIRRHFPRAEVVALGGATEATVWSNYYRVGAVDPSWPSIPYGRPMQNARYHVRDESLRPCPVGTPGDLYIAGECVALGYAGDPALTGRRFIRDPHDPDGATMYRTGDRARWLPDGNLQFLGRADHQVKIRGYRIELGDVESALSRHPAVTEAVAVVAGRASGADLVAFYTCRSDPVAPEDLRRHAARTLPSYMVPAAFVRLDALPVTDNGKVDRAALLRSAAGGRPRRAGTGSR